MTTPVRSQAPETPSPTSGATVTQVGAPDAGYSIDGTYVAGDVITISVHFSEVDLSVCSLSLFYFSLSLCSLSLSLSVLSLSVSVQSVVFSALLRP